MSIAPSHVVPVLSQAAFIVDSTSAPISSLTPVSAWAAYETGLIAAGLRHIGDTERDPYMLFLATVSISTPLPLPPLPAVATAVHLQSIIRQGSRFCFTTEHVTQSSAARG